MSDDQNVLSDRPELQEKLSELEILKQSLDAAKIKEKETHHQFLLLGAEFQNYRKRTEARLTEARQMGKEDVLLNIISLCDTLAQAESSSQQAKDVDSIRKGLKMVKEQFEKFLNENGLVPLKSKGEKLDPERHEALARVENDEMEEGTVIDEIQRGYTLNGRVVRPARVTVATKPSDKEPKGE